MIQIFLTAHLTEIFSSLQIENRKLNWNAQSKIRSLDNHSHKPGGGEKKIENRKLEWNVESKVGSTKNITHKAGGGRIKVARSSIRSLLELNSYFV